MVLSDKDIKDSILEKRIVVKPLPNFSEQLGSFSLDLRLGNTFRVFEYGKHHLLDPFKKDGENITRVVKVRDGDRFIIHPSDFILATTLEYIELPDDFIGILEGRSSIGRMGIVIHSTAGRIDAGFRGNIALEIANMGKIPVALYPGMRICSISFEQLSSPAEVPYYKKEGAKYVGQKGPDETKIYKDKL